MICDKCETVAHCMKNGCVPKTTKKDVAMKLALEAITTYLSESPAPSEEAVEGLHDAASILKKAKPEQPAPVAEPRKQLDLPDFIAGALGVSRGTAYDMMREALKEKRNDL